MSFVHGHRGLSRLTTNWNCARFFSSNLKGMWQQYKAQMQLFFFSWASLFNNTCSSERLPMTWVRSHKDCYFWMLNLLFIKNHNTLILRYLVKVSIFALWQKYRKSSGHVYPYSTSVHVSETLVHKATYQSLKMPWPRGFEPFQLQCIHLALPKT